MARITKPMMDRGGEGGDGADLAYVYRRKVGNRVRQMRLDADMTQRQLGDHLDIGETAISALELGRSTVSPERYGQLAELFGLDKAEWGKWLLRYTDPYLYALLFNDEIDAQLAADLKSLAVTTRVNRTRGPRR